MARIPGQGVAASTGGPTTPGTATTEVQEPGATSPLLGLTPPDFTNWSLLLPEALLTGDYLHLWEVLLALEDKQQAHGHLAYGPQHHLCRH